MAGPWAAGHPTQMGPAGSQGGFPVLPEPVPGARRSQMSVADSDHSTCLSSWEEGAGLALGTGCEGMKRPGPDAECCAGWACERRFAPRGGRRGGPPCPSPSPSRRWGVIPTWPAAAARISGTDLSLFPLGLPAWAESTACHRVTSLHFAPYPGSLGDHPGLL